MIELEMTPIILNKHKSFVFDNNSKKDRIYKKLELLVQSEKNIKFKEIFLKIFKELENIILGDVETLQNYVNWFDNLIKKMDSIEEKKEIREKLSIFLDEYTYFIKRENHWNAYSFLKELDITICPYCNSQYIFLYNSRKIINESIEIHGKTRAVLDHFFDKGHYPFLAISIYNLVPSCKVCNSDFKGKKKMDLKKFYSPYEKGLGSSIKFRRVFKIGNGTTKTELDSKLDYYSSMIGLNSEFELSIDTISENQDIQRKVEGNIEIFHLKDVYNIFHKKYVMEIVFKAHVYSKVYRGQLNKTYDRIFLNEQDLRKNLFEDAVSDKHKMLGKLTRDILEDEINKLL